MAIHLFEVRITKYDPNFEEHMNMLEWLKSNAGAVRKDWWYNGIVVCSGLIDTYKYSFVDERTAIQFKLAFS